MSSAWLKVLSSSWGIAFWPENPRSRILILPSASAIDTSRMSPVKGDSAPLERDRWPALSRFAAAKVSMSSAKQASELDTSGTLGTSSASFRVERCKSLSSLFPVF
jgi:hypothetical protein